MLQKNQPSNTWISWVNIQMMNFPLSREKVFQFDLAVFFDMRSAPHDFFLLGLNLNALHDLLRVIFLEAPCLSVRPSVSNLSVMIVR